MALPMKKTVMKAMKSAAMKAKAMKGMKAGKCRGMFLLKLAAVASLVFRVLR